MASRSAEECHDIVAHGGTVDDALAYALAVSDDDEDAYCKMMKGVEEDAYDKMMQQEQQQERKGKGKERAKPCRPRDRMAAFWERDPNYTAALKGVRKSARAAAAKDAQRVGDLWADPQFVDAFVECPHLSFATRRALHCTTAGLRRKMREFFKRPTLVLREEDCTNGNAAFLFGHWPDTFPNDWSPGPLICWNPRVVLRFEPPDGCDEGAIPSVAINDWMAAHQLAPGEPLDPQGAKVFRVPSKGISEVATFFLGRAWATLSDGMIQLVDPSRTWEEQFTLGDRAASRVRLSSMRQHRVPIGTIRTDHMLRSEFAFLAGAYFANARRWLRDVAKVQREGVRVFSLDLSHRFLDEAGVEALARALRPAPPPPKPLRSFPKKKLPKGKVLLKPEGKGLLKLNLSHTFNPTFCHSWNARAGLLAPILRGEVATDRLRDLNLSGNRMGVEGMIALERACEKGDFKPTALVKLRLRHVNLTHDAMMHFAPLLGPEGALRRLELLDIGANPFNDASLHDLQEESTGMPCLSNLKLDGCNGLTTLALQNVAYAIKNLNQWPKIRWVRLYSGEYPLATDNQRKTDLLMRSAVACVRAQNKWVRIQAMPAHQTSSVSFYSSDEEAASSDSYMSYGPGSEEDVSMSDGD